MRHGFGYRYLPTLYYHVASLNLVSSNAVSGSDFLSTRSLRIISSGHAGNTSRRCFTVGIIDDHLYEGTESFTIELAMDDLSDISSGVIFEPNVTEIIIVDDDGMNNCDNHATQFDHWNTGLGAYFETDIFRSAMIF